MELVLGVLSNRRFPDAHTTLAYARPRSVHGSLRVTLRVADHKGWIHSRAKLYMRAGRDGISHNPYRTLRSKVCRFQAFQAYGVPVHATREKRSGLSERQSCETSKRSRLPYRTSYSRAQLYCTV